jgi:hypothetical protein
MNVDFCREALKSLREQRVALNKERRSLDAAIRSLEQIVKGTEEILVPKKTNTKPRKGIPKILLSEKHRKEIAAAMSDSPHKAKATELAARYGCSQATIMAKWKDWYHRFVLKTPRVNGTGEMAHKEG